MKIKFDSKTVLELNSDLIVLGLFDEQKHLDKNFVALEKALNNTISDYVFGTEQFKLKFLSTYTLPTLGKISTPKVLIVGLGKKDEYTADRARQVAMDISKKIKTYKNVVNAVVSLPMAEKEQETIQTIAEGLVLGAYSFDKYKTEKTKDVLKMVVLSCPDCDKTAKKGILKGEVLANATNFARNLSNEPAQYATPAKLAEIASNLPNITTQIYDKAACKRKGMNAFLAVGQGSDQPPKLIHMVYKPAKKATKKVALIGKGITFDSGGYDIKPPSSMLNMKDDMSGAAAVLAVMQALPDLAPNVEVHGIIAACENMLNGSSYKPGDVLTAKNGKTIEVDNTDAEGRITLADALCYAEELKVDEIIDIATLTGACVVALGHFASAVMGNDDNLIAEIEQASEKSGEAFWKLPIWDAHMDSLKSDIADMKNTGSRYAGASVAGAFLKNFVSSAKWAHLDVAGTAFIESPYKGFIKGGTGVPVRTLLEFITK